MLAKRSLVTVLTMLGWEVFVFRTTAARQEDLIARWRTGLSGLRWIDQLVESGLAADLGGGGYPNTYSATAGKLLPILTRGIPSSDGPLVIGDNYVLPAHWSSEIEWGRENALACQPDDVLYIEAWDQS